MIACRLAHKQVEKELVRQRNINKADLLAEMPNTFLKI